MKRLALQCIFFLAVTGVAFASGDHPGGHGHGHDDGVGNPGQKANVNRTVHIDMSDEMRFVPDHLTVKQGETIRFLLKNTGEIDHEFVLGSEDALREHYEMMKKFPGMEHEDPNQVRVFPGQVGEVIWQFTKSGKIDFGCLISGHFGAGMKGAVVVGSASNETDGKERTKHSHEGHQH